MTGVQSSSDPDRSSSRAGGVCQDVVQRMSVEGGVAEDEVVEEAVELSVSPSHPLSRVDVAPVPCGYREDEPGPGPHRQDRLNMRGDDERFDLVSASRGCAGQCTDCRRGLDEGLHCPSQTVGVPGLLGE